MKLRFLPVAVLGALGLSFFAQAQAQNYNQINFDTSVSQQIANDELRAKLSKTSQSADAKSLANTINQTLNQALTIAKKYPEVKVSTGQQDTYPRYNKNGTLTGFTGSATLHISSQDFAKASELIAELQSIMTMEDLNFSVSDKTKQSAETTLRQQAIKRFQDEATSISQSFGAKSYKIVNISLNSDTYQRQYEYAPLAASSMSKVATQEFAGGDSQLTYRVSGTIELIP